jgi:aspartate carbamoyltransferase regulatory subunit
MKELTISAIKSGSVIDHIPPEQTLKVLSILGLQNSEQVVSVAWNLSSKKLGKKGILKIGGKNLTDEEVNKIALVAPNAHLNIIKNFEVVKKIELTIPKKIEGIVKCFNPNCITNIQPVKSRMHVISDDPLILKCDYCERLMKRDDVEVR